MVVARVRCLQREIGLGVLQGILLCLHFAAPPNKVGLDQFHEDGLASLVIGTVLCGSYGPLS